MREMYFAKQSLRDVTACVLVTIFAIPQTLFAQAAAHVVSSADLQKAAVDASRGRQQNLETLKEFFSSEKAQQALKAAHTAPERGKNAGAGLSGAELAPRAWRPPRARAALAPGALAPRERVMST